jgi:hypothetical protein
MTFRGYTVPGFRPPVRFYTSVDLGGLNRAGIERREAPHMFTGEWVTVEELPVMYWTGDNLEWRELTVDEATALARQIPGHDVDALAAEF